MVKIHTKTIIRIKTDFNIISNNNNNNNFNSNNKYINKIITTQ